MTASARPLVLALALAAPILGASPSVLAAPQAAATGEQAKPPVYFRVVGDDVYVRCGAADSYYPMLKVGKDAIVSAVDETQYGWRRVTIVGPAFGEAFGIVKHARDAASPLAIAADGTTARAVGRVEVLAPNLNEAYRPDAAWKRLARVADSTVLRVLERTETDKDIVYRVAVPAGSTAWINEKLLAPATKADFDQYLARMGGAPTEPVLARNEPKPAPTVATPAGAGAPGATGTTPSGTGSPTTAAPTTGGTTPATPATTAPATTAPAVTTPAPAPVETAPPSLTAKAKFEALESAYDKLQREPIETAEVTELRDLYLALADEYPDKTTIVRYCTTRGEQLKIWSELQERSRQLAELKRKLEVADEERSAARVAMEARGGYAAVGRLVASTIFEGQRLPRFLRLQDPTTGRTLAYLAADRDDFDLDGMLGQVIGVTGDQRFDPGLRINVIDPRKIDLLVPTKQPG